MNECFRRRQNGFPGLSAYTGDFSMLGINSKHQLAGCTAEPQRLAKRPVPGHHAPVVGQAHQQRSGRRSRPRDLDPDADPDQRSEPGRVERQRRRVDDSNGIERTVVADEQPAAYPPAGRPGVDGHDVHDRPGRTAAGSFAADPGSEPYRVANDVQRHEHSRRLGRHRVVPGRRERRPDDFAGPEPKHVGREDRRRPGAEGPDGRYGDGSVARQQRRVHRFGRNDHRDQRAVRR
ncbi:Uncharacterised protein [Clostridium sporogenes]|nr:Uncharacterised protein [Clostridium sporogenes]